jgi:pimeloyl-ACP methyl ester carboxylesterase
MLVERQLDTGSITINYATGLRDDPPLVLLHGFMDRWQEWIPIADDLMHQWRLVAPDMRGHGRTDRAPDGVYRHEDVVADLLAVVDETITEPAVVFGHSGGVPGAVEAALRRPDLVRVLVLGDLPIDMPWLFSLVRQPEMMAFHAAIRDLAGREAGEIEPTLAALSPDRSPAQIRDWAESLAMLDPRLLDFHAEGRLEDYFGDFGGEALLAEVAQPTLVLQADPAHGGVVTDEHLAQMVDLLPAGTGVRLEGTGHNLGLDTGEVGPLLAALEAFLSTA